MTGHAESRAAVEGVWRREAARVIARLSRLTRDVGLAEELAQDALVAALETWPQTGVPVNPGAWLVTTGKNRALDRLRKRKLVARKHEALGAEMMAPDPSPADEAMDDFIGDDLLRLVFQACHPVLSLDAQVALTLRMLGGLTTDEIASAFLAPSPTIAQRIVRAKRRLSEAQVAFELPRGEELWGRTQAVLRVIYLVFSEGYSASAGESLTRAELSGEAIRLGRLLAQLLPEPESIGLLALMLLQESRRETRTTAEGDLVLLDAQDRSQWNRALIAEGTKLVERALVSGRAGPYALQAAIAAVHA
ncbi:MAG: RNA polymerase subunit sigma-24, partial [Myxococcales bacterium]|nr:RNA polymerase subunit sigma-24 [Myxococcales bacterium]